VSFDSSAPGSAEVGGSFAVSVSSSSGLPPVLSVAPNSISFCSVTGSQVRFIGAGSCTLAVNQAGNANYLAAAEVTQTFPISKGTQVNRQERTKNTLIFFFPPFFFLDVVFLVSASWKCRRWCLVHGCGNIHGWFDGHSHGCWFFVIHLRDQW
jgi:hypothetical protein